MGGRSGWQKISGPGAGAGIENRTGKTKLPTVKAKNKSPHPKRRISHLKYLLPAL